MKSLKTVQTIYKVFSVLAKIVFICAIIGAAGSLVGALVMLIAPIFGEDFVNLIISGAEVDNITQLAVGLVAEAIFLAGQIVTTWYVCRYMKNELKDGTPFTERGADELMRTGIINLAVGFGAYVVASTVAVLAGAGDFMSEGFSIFGGLIMILSSFIFRYGAELAGAADKD